jgi:hypothetical protein
MRLAAVTGPGNPFKRGDIWERYDTLFYEAIPEIKVIVPFFFLLPSEKRRLTPAPPPPADLSWKRAISIYSHFPSVPFLKQSGRYLFPFSPRCHLWKKW